MIANLICAHLVGDFLLQNEEMQAKSKSAWVCTVHVSFYALPFLFLVSSAGLSVWLLAAILLQHWFQDRFALHLRYMRFFGHTTPEKWPMGPLCVDQAMHIGFMWYLCLLCY